MIQLGDDLQNDGISRLEGMNQDLYQGNELLVDANTELLRQRDKLLLATEHTKDMTSTLSKFFLLIERAKKMILYFSKEYYKDKFVRIMIILMILVIIITLAWSIFK